ncbi:ROK family protein [Streptosporangium pseudovulgare]|uniref:ROK family protein n=1 Tax=Streptosporangium pseudovulgare TaxID=35765 RepID=A0ABQ2R5C4_9ACTN|nr:ROK family protein [Streptosporangium pseudovulgare]GGQ14575.1 hypothetical protein GCM10010140_51100 [Streptosporangium pseudovulgare]
MTHALAVDIGGTKIAAALVDPRGAVSHRRTRPTPRTDDPEEVFRTVARLAAREGRAVATAAFDRAARALAGGMLSAAAAVDLDLVVVGGGVARSGDVLFTPLRTWFERLAGLDFLRRVRLRPSALGGDAGLVGAAALTRRPATAGRTARR